MPSYGRVASAAAGLVVASGLVLAVAPSASAASGGGCEKSTAKDYGNWSFKACISAKGHQVRPSFYIYKKGKNILGSHKCGIQATLWYTPYYNHTQKEIWHKNFSCKKGYIPYTKLTTRTKRGYYSFGVSVGGHNTKYGWVGYYVNSPIVRNY
jgi:hypothetical protein